MHVGLQITSAWNFTLPLTTIFVYQGFSIKYTYLLFTLGIAHSKIQSMRLAIWLDAARVWCTNCNTHTRGKHT